MKMRSLIAANFLSLGAKFSSLLAIALLSASVPVPALSTFPAPFTSNSMSPPLALTSVVSRMTQRAARTFEIDSTTSDVTIPMGVLVADVNGNGSVNASDVANTKARVGQAVGATNFRSDVNANGIINASDIANVKSRTGTALPIADNLQTTPTVTSAVSRKTHGAAGAFDIALPLTGTAGIECRAGEATNDYMIVVTFSGNVSVTGNPQAQVTSGSGTIGSGGMGNGGTVTVSGSTVTIPLTNVANAQTINVTLFGVSARTLYEPPQPAPGEPCDCGGSAGGAPELPYLHLFSGEVHYSTVDLRIKGRGLDFIWARKYRSRLGPSTGQGNGWDFSYNIRIQELGQDLEVFDGNTRQDIFVRQSDGKFVADQFFREGAFDGAGVFTMKFADTGTWTFRPLDGSAAQGKIAAITDRNGNALTMTYDASGRLIKVTDTLARDIMIGYNTGGYIASVTDFAGRQVSYAYYTNAEAGGSFGDLKSATSPVVLGTPNGNDFPVGKTTVYTYSKGLAEESLNHNLLTVTDPKGQTWLHNVYAATMDPSDANFDRLTSQAVGSSTQRMQLFYVAQTPTPANGFAVVKTILNDRVGNVSEHLYDAGNRLVNHRAFTGRATPGQVTTEKDNRPAGQLRPSDPAFFETRYEWNIDSMPMRIVHPNSNITENIYELALNPNAPRRARGNLRLMRRLPGPLGGDQAQLVEQFEYAPDLGGCCGTNFVIKATDARGHETLHDYDSRGNRTHTQHRIPSIVEDWEYNAFGQMTAHILPDNGSGHRRRDEMTYYAFGPQQGYLHQQIVDVGGFNLTQSYEYNAVGDVIRHIDARGHDTLFAVNQLDQVVRQTSREVTDGSGIRYQRDTFFDANDNTVRTDVQNIDDQGVLQANTHFTTAYDYENLNRLIRTTQEVNPTQNIVMEYAYDANRNRTLVRSGEAVNGNQPANTRTTLYDERDLPFRETRAAGSGAGDQSTMQLDYDANGNLNRTSHGLENAPRITLRAYDGYNRRTASTDAMGNVATMHYDANGNMLSERVDGQLTDAPGGVDNVRLSEVNHTYDVMDRRTRSDVAFFDTETQAAIDDGQSSTQTFYSDNSQVIRVLDDHNHQTLTTYDTANRRRAVTDAKGNTITYGYDANNNVVTTTELDKSDLGNPDETFLTQYAHDNLDRMTRAVDNVDNMQHYAYDSRNNRVLYTDARSNQTRYEYDGLNRLITTDRLVPEQPDGHIITQQTWDDSSRLSRQIDDNGNTTTYIYDALDRRVMTDYADCTMDSTAYDVHNNAVSTTDANGTTVTNAYDLLNRLTNKTVSVFGAGVVAPPLGTSFENYQYDGLSRPIRAEDNDSLVTRGSATTSGYDSLSNVLRENQQRLNPAVPPHLVSAVYDSTSNQTRLVSPGGRAISRSYDLLDRPSVINDDPPSGPPIATYAYIGPYRVEQRDYPKLSPDATIRFTPLYDGIRRITATLHNRVPGGPPIDHRFYDWDPTHNKAGMHRPPIPPSPAPEDRLYTYDAANRLSRSEVMAGGPPTTIDYGLDGVGNRQQVIGGPDSGPYTMDPALCEPGDFQMNQYTTTPANSRTYDTNGNLTGTTLPQTFAYDYRNQLVRHVNGPVTTTYRYNCLGRRIEKNVGGAITRFYYDGNEEIEEQDAANATVATYVYSKGRHTRLQMVRGGQKYYYHEDDLGSVMKVTDSSGNPLESYSYGDIGTPSFFNQSGNQIGQSNIGNPWLFHGHRFDAESGLYRTGNRYLASASGRFIQRTPGGIWSAAIDLGNAYNYAANNPTSSGAVAAAPGYSPAWGCGSRGGSGVGGFGPGYSFVSGGGAGGQGGSGAGDDEPFPIFPPPPPENEWRKIMRKEGCCCTVTSLEGEADQRDSEELPVWREVHKGDIVCTPRSIFTGANTNITLECDNGTSFGVGSTTWGSMKALCDKAKKLIEEGKLEPGKPLPPGPKIELQKTEVKADMQVVPPAVGAISG